MKRTFTDQQNANRLTDQAIRRIQQMTDVDMLLLEKVTKMVIAEVEAQAPTEPLSDKDEDMLHLTIAATYWYLVVEPRKRRNDGATACVGKV